MRILKSSHRGRVLVGLSLLALSVLGTIPPAGAGERPFDLLTIGFHSSHGAFCGLARRDSLAGGELRSGLLFAGGQTAVQVGLYRRLLPDVTALLAINEPLPGLGPGWDLSRQFHGDILWKDLLGLSLDGKGEQRQLSLNIWRIPIPIAGHIDGVPWVLR